MRISKLFNIFSPDLIAQRTCIYFQNYENQNEYLKYSKQIAACENLPINLVLERDSNFKLKIAGIENSTDVFKMISLETLANIDSGETNFKLFDAIEILEDYCFFKI